MVFKLHCSRLKTKIKNRATFIIPKTKRINNIEFGASNYQQFKDSTPLKLFKDKDHKDPERKTKYYKRHGPDEGIFFIKRLVF